MRSLHPLFGAAFLLALGLTGCRGWTSDQPPVHLNPNMDTQEKYKPYRASDFFADGRAMRDPPAGTVARTVSGAEARDQDFLRQDDTFYQGTQNGATLAGLPSRLQVSGEMLQRGQQRYDIYCAPCHARHGNGLGTVAGRLAIKPPNFHDDNLRGKSVSHFYRIITHGKPLPEDRADPTIKLNMPSYAAQISVEDRWAIALYVRALQQSQYSGGKIPVDGLGAAAPATDAPASTDPATLPSPADGSAAAEPAANDGSTP